MDTRCKVFKGKNTELLTNLKISSFLYARLLQFKESRNCWYDNNGLKRPLSRLPDQGTPNGLFTVLVLFVSFRYSNDRFVCCCRSHEIGSGYYHTIFRIAFVWRNANRK